jgi:endo-1,4-beta-D-glucanase Y
MTRGLKFIPHRLALAVDTATTDSDDERRPNSRLPTMRSLTASFLLLAASAVAQTPARPFPQHVTYTAGTIRPINATQAQLDSAVTDFYDIWKARYIHAGCESGQLYVFYNREKTADNPKAISVSEGHGYGMVITALMAGHDADARTQFDQLYAFFRAHPSEFTPDLMAWLQITGCKEPLDGKDSATDGDLDIAYALLLADAQWGSAGAINYRVEALKVIAGIKKGDINTATPSIELGDWVGDSDSNLNDTRLSDFMLNHFRAFNRATGDALWLALIDKCYAAVDYLQTNHAPKTGLVPDFARKLNTGKPEPAKPKFLESKNDGQYSYNACRFPWRVGVDYLVVGDARAKTALEKINAFIEHATGGDPDAIRAGYKLKDGKAIDKEDTSLAFNAPFAVGAMVDARHQQWLDKLWTNIVATQAADSDYYGNTLKLLSMIVASGNWWAP